MRIRVPEPCRLHDEVHAAGSGLQIRLVSNVVSFAWVRGRPPRPIRHSPPTSRTVVNPGERWAALLESVLGATPREFESRILRHADLRRRAWIMFARCATSPACVSFSVSVEPRVICLIPDKSMWWHAEMTHVVPSQGRRGRN